MTQEAFPAGEMTAFAADSPYARCVRGGEPVIFARPDSQTLERARPGGREIMSRYASFLAVPATAGAEVAGFLAFARTAGSAAFNDADAATAARLAAGTGTGIANALTLMRHRFIADTLQRSLLAAEPIAPPGLEVTARCLPAAGQIVGGDWYDLVTLPAGRSGVIVGDVMGHGPEAAAVMAQLRAAAHALAQLDLEPAELLGHLDQVTATLGRPCWPPASTRSSTRPASPAPCRRRPPAAVLAMPDGTTRVPDLPAGQSLGLGSAVYGQARIKFPPGAIIALYTDGLVESRTRSFDQGILALRSVLAREHGDLEDICDPLIAALAARAKTTSRWSWPASRPGSDCLRHPSICERRATVRVICRIRWLRGSAPSPVRLPPASPRCCDRASGGRSLTSTRVSASRRAWIEAKTEL